MSKKDGEGLTITLRLFFGCQKFKLDKMLVKGQDQDLKILCIPQALK